MESSGADKPDILIIGEAPGETEDYKGIPFVGKAGKLLRDALGEFTDISTIRFTNVVRCRPPENKITKRVINYCAQFALDEIEQYDPPIVMLLGNSPLNAVLGQTGISSWNGVIVEKNDRVYLPLFHPAYILRNEVAMDEWLQGMNKLSEDTNRKPKFERSFPKTLEDLDAMEKHLATCEYISFDVETNMLNAYGVDAKIISISFAGGGKSYSFPVNPRGAWWSTDIPKGFKAKHISELEYAVGIVLNVLHTHAGKLIGHNIKFDQMHIAARYGLDTQAGGDSMLISHLLDSRPGIHGLKRLAGIHLGMYEYEQELSDYIRAHPEANPSRGGSYDFIPFDILLPYGAMDAEATLMLHDKLYLELTDKQKILYNQMILPASDMLCRMQCNGIMLDDYIAKRYTQIYRIKREEVYAAIHQDKYVKKFVRAKQKELLATVKRKKTLDFKFNPNSFLQLQILYYKYYKIPVLGYTDSGGPTTKAATLRPLEDKYPILQKIRYYKLMTKMLGTYLQPAAEGSWKSADGRVRTTYNLHGTKTGRISSGGDVKDRTKINLLNIPTAEKEPNTLLQILPIKNLFTHSYMRNGICRTKADFQTKFKDGAVVSIDESGMELRVFASLAKCYAMIDIHKSGRDFHSTVAIMAQIGKRISEVTDDDIAGLEKAVRYRYKWTNWTLLYGGGKETLMGLYGMGEAEAEAVIEEYFACFPEVKTYGDECVTFAEMHGYIESPFGRRERLYYINDDGGAKRNADRRASKNMPTQSGAGDTVLIAAIIIDDKLRQAGFQTKLVNTVYDSVLLDAPRDEVVQVSYICKDVMENVTKYAKIYMPDIDMSWLISPLKADVEAGTHYGAIMDLEKWQEANHVYE